MFSNYSFEVTEANNVSDLEGNEGFDIWLDIDYRGYSHVHCLHVSDDNIIEEMTARIILGLAETTCIDECLVGRKGHTSICIEEK